MNVLYTGFEGIGIKIIDKFVLVCNDETLVHFLSQKSSKALELAKVMKNKYKEECG